MFRTGKVPVRSAKEPVRYPGHFFRGVATATPPIIAAITDKGAFILGSYRISGTSAIGRAARVSKRFRITAGLAKF